MANQGMLRGEGLREARGSIDTGSGEKRTGGTSRKAHMSRGTFINFYEDLGISATPEGAKQIRAGEAKFKKDTAAQQLIINQNKQANERNRALLAKSSSQISSIKGGYESAQGALNDYKGAEVPDWNTFRNDEYARGYGVGDYKKVSLYERGGKSLYGEWYIPTETANKLAANTDSYWGGENGSRDIKMIIKHASHLPTIAEQLQSGSNQVSNAIGNVYSDVKAQAAGVDVQNMNQLQGNIGAYGTALTKAQEEYNQINQGVSSLQAMIDTQNMKLKGAKDTRAGEWASIHKKREDKLKGMKDFFSTLNLGVN